MTNGHIAFDRPAFQYGSLNSSDSAFRTSLKLMETAKITCFKLVMSLTVHNFLQKGLINNATNIRYALLASQFDYEVVSVRCCKHTKIF